MEINALKVKITSFVNHLHLNFGKKVKTTSKAALVIDGGNGNKFDNCRVNGGAEIRSGNANEFIDTKISK